MLDFPKPPNVGVGDLYPDPAIEGLPQWTWDGDRWMPAISGGSGVLSSSGGTISGDLAVSGVLRLAGDPQGPLDAATKQYVDDEVQEAGGGGPYTGTGDTLVLQDQPTINQPALMGVANASVAPPGAVGQVLQSSNSITTLTYSATLMTTPTYNTLTSLDVPSGDWLLWAYANMQLRYDSGNPNATNAHVVQFNLGGTSGGQIIHPFTTLLGSGVHYLTVRAQYVLPAINFAAQTTVRLDAAIVVPGTPDQISVATGLLRARRMR